VVAARSRTRVRAKVRCALSDTFDRRTFDNT
jgi:hypothetical protein